MQPLMQPHRRFRTVAPCTHGRSYGLNEEEVGALRSEQASAELAGMQWHQRGPLVPGGVEEGPTFWRGQVFRQGRDGGPPRWANRGGRYREYYADLARQGRNIGGPQRGHTPRGQLPQHGGSNSSTTGKGKDKGKGAANDKGKGKDKGKGAANAKGKGPKGVIR